VGRRALIGIVAIALAASAVAALWPRGSEDPGRHATTRPAAAHRKLPEPVRPAFVPGTPHILPAGQRAWRYAPVRRAVIARAQPREGALAVAPLSTRTPEGTTNIVLGLGQRRDGAGRLWVRVRLPVLPNARTAWVPRAALGGYVFVRTHLLVDRARFIATLYRGTRRVFQARVGVGRPESETPAGAFYVRNKLTRYRSAMYGPLAFGTSARSPRLTDWPAGGFVGIHGTDRPDLLPGRVSHGCIRMRNADILALGRLMPVGTPVTIR
jgi:hypothetical protein